MYQESMCMHNYGGGEGKPVDILNIEIERFH